MSLKRPLVILLTMLFAFGIFLVGTAFLYPEKLIYHPSPYKEAELEAFAESGGITLDFETDQGTQYAYYIAPKDAADAKSLPERLWIVSGGNASRALGWVSYFATHGKPGEGFILVDYPGYGACEGDPSPDSIQENITAALTAAAAHFDVKTETLTERLHILGHSLGAAAALTAAIEHGAKKIVVISPFTSMKDMATKTVGKQLAMLLTHRYDNRASLLALDGKGIPVTVVHGKNDRFIPPEMGQELAEMFPGWITWIPVDGAGHNDILSVAGARIAEAMNP